MAENYESKPKVFVASSVGGLDVAYALQENLEHIAEVTVWPQGVFELSTYTLDELLEEGKIFDFAVFVFSFEDLSIIRGKEVKTTRDNVLLELGLFLSQIGRQRCFILMPKTKRKEKLHLPTDLIGIKPAVYNPTRSDKNLLAALGPASNQVARTIKKLGKLKKEKLSDILIQQISNAGLTAFYQSRKDYAKYRNSTSTIDSYISTAKHNVHMVSINLMTGVVFDDVLSVLEEKLKHNSDFVCMISLLNPWQRYLMSAISPVLGMSTEKLTGSIKETLSKLSILKQKLPNEVQGRFEIRVHKAIPFGSAIMIDVNSGEGKIQIETKPYKYPLGKSFAFEISNKGENKLFKTLRDGYFRLIEEGETYDYISKKLQEEEKNEKI